MEFACPCRSGKSGSRHGLNGDLAEALRQEELGDAICGFTIGGIYNPKRLTLKATDTKRHQFSILCKEALR